MDRRNFLKTGTLMAGAAGITARSASPFVPAHNWDKYDFGAGPPVANRLNQGPFPEYPPERIFPGGEVVMATTPTKEVVPNFGKGLVTYIAADMGTAEIVSDNKAQAIEELAQLPLGQQALHPPDLARNPAAARAPGIPGLLETDVRPRQTARQRRRLPDPDARPGLRARKPCPISFSKKSQW